MAFRSSLSFHLLKQLRRSFSLGEAAVHFHVWTPLGVRDLCKQSLISGRSRLLQNDFQCLLKGSRRHFSAAGETNLAAFLKEEIEAEKQHAIQNYQKEGIPTFPGFEVVAEQAEIKLTKTQGNEEITVTFNVNHAIEPTENTEEAETEVPGEEQQAASMIARPPFLVEISKGKQKLAFDCQISESSEFSESGETGGGDLFQIEELYMYEGEMNEKTYASSASVIDGALYDHLMGYLEQRGIDNKFAEYLMQLATHYEHNQYVELLQKIKDFVAQ